MILLAGLVGLLLLVVAIENPRRGALVTLGVGFGQDLLRKVAPGEPVALTAAIIVFFAATCAAAIRRGLPVSLDPLHRRHPLLRVPMNLFLALAVVQIGVTLVRTRSPQLVAIGVIEYVAPTVGLVFAFAYGARTERVTSFLRFYVLAASAMAVGVFLEVFGVGWKLLGSVGEGLFIYSRSGGRIELPSGFFRSPESAAWHAAAALCLLIVLVVSRYWRPGWWSAVLLGLLLLGAVLLSGRRKAVVEVVVFLAVYGGLLAMLRRGATKLAAFLFAAGSTAFVLQWLALPGNRRDFYRPYVERSASIGEELWERFQLTTIDMVRGALYENGLLGAGAGMGGGGAQYFGGGVVGVGGGGESGLGRIAAELGVLGLVLALWLAVAFVRSVWRTLTACATSQSHTMAEGFSAFLLANLLVFISAAQIFGDPTVLLTLGFLSGFLLASPARRDGDRAALWRSPARVVNGRQPAQSAAQVPEEPWPDRA